MPLEMVRLTIYNFRDDIWESGATVLGKNIYQIDGGAVGIWNRFSVDLTPFVYDTDDNDKNVEIAISFPANASTFDSTFIDNFTIGEKVSINFNEVTCKRRRFSYDSGFTGKYETTNIMSNELADDDNFTGQIEGSYERPRDTNPKTLEAIITQEIMNDSRDYMTKYEGVFRNIDSTNIGLHNKMDRLWDRQLTRASKRVY